MLFLMLFDYSKESIGKGAGLAIESFCTIKFSSEPGKGSKFSVIIPGTVPEIKGWFIDSINYNTHKKSDHLSLH